MKSRRKLGQNSSTPTPTPKNGGEVRCNFTQHRASFKRNLQIVPENSLFQAFSLVETAHDKWGEGSSALHY